MLLGEWVPWKSSSFFWILTLKGFTETSSYDNDSYFITILENPGVLKTNLHGIYLGPEECNELYNTGVIIILILILYNINIDINMNMKGIQYP